MNRMNLYARPVPDATRVENETLPVLNRNATDNKLLFGIGSVTTVYENFLHGMNVAGGPSSPIFGYREKVSRPGVTGALKWITYGDFHDRFRSIARGFRGLGLQRGDTIGIYSDNRLEWPLVEFATYYHGYISVAIYETMSQKSTEYIINLTELTTIVVTPECAKNLLKMREKIPLVKKLVLMETPAQDLVDKLTELDFSVYDMTDVEKYGRESPEMPFNAPTYDDVATIVFTSGTTDQPKGAIITHGNIVSTVAGISYVVDQKDFVHVGPSDCN
ncbi:medium-chain fatty acid-CoA ligase faa2, partial [Dipsacomyces acuminosporus]